MLLKYLAFADIILVASVVGVFWGTWLSLSRSIDTFSAEMFLAIGRRMIKNLAVPMRILMIGMLLMSAVLCFLLFHDGHRVAGVLNVLGLLTMVSVVIVTVTINVPIDLKIRQWMPDNLPADWQAIRRRWEKYNVIRTVLSVVGLCLTVAGVVTLI
jgi:uncharacterized membrane protein